MRSWLTALTLSLCAFAQDSATFRVNTQLVEVDVLVHSKSGPVASLTKDDFAVYDNGKLQSVTVFSRQTAATRNAVRPSALAPGEVSNRLNRNGQEPASPTIILWDALNTALPDQAWVRSQVVKYLACMQPGDPVAVFILEKDLRIIQDFTEDSAPLISAVKRTKAEQSTDLSAPDLADLLTSNSLSVLETDQNAAVIQRMEAMATNAAGEMTDYALRDRVYVTEAGLKAIAEHLSGLPGRKKLVWVSGSFPAIQNVQRDHGAGPGAEILDFAPQIEAAIQALNGANVAVYPVDPRGVTTADGLTASGIDTMNLLASGTGGKAFYATNDIAGAVDSTMRDDSVIYRLGFYPRDEKLDGSYHTLSVKLNHKGSGEDLRARRGYYAMDGKSTADGHWRQMLNESMQNPLESTALGLKASLQPLPKTPGGYNLRVSIDLSGVHLEHVKNRWIAQIAYGTMLIPSASTKGTLETIQLALTGAKLKKALDDDGYVLSRDVILGDFQGNLRVAISDMTTGFNGSVSLPVGQPPVGP